MAKSQHFVAKIVPLFKAIVCELCLRFFSSVFSFCKDVSFIDHAPGVWLLDDWKLAINWKKRQWRHNCLTHVIVSFFDIAVFLLWSLVTGISFMSISQLLWQFLFIKDWPEIWKSKISPSEFYPISGDWSELGIPNLAWMSLIKCYWMPQNAKVIYTISELLRENQD